MTYAEVVSEIYQLSPAERLSLIDVIQESLEANNEGEELSILDLEGIGAEIWQGIDAQAYVNEIRQEWDHRP